MMNVSDKSPPISIYSNWIEKCLVDRCIYFILYTESHFSMRNLTVQMDFRLKLIFCTRWHTISGCQCQPCMHKNIFRSIYRFDILRHNIYAYMEAFCYIPTEFYSYRARELAKNSIPNQNALLFVYTVFVVVHSENTWCNTFTHTKHTNAKSMECNCLCIYSELWINLFGVENFGEKCK